MKPNKHSKSTNKKLRSYLFLLFILLYNASITLHIGIESSVINSSLDTLAIPNGFFLTNFTIPEPEFQISVGFSNTGSLEIKNFEVNVSLNLSYDYLPTNQSYYEKFLSKKINFGSIKRLSRYNYTIKSELSDFDVNVLSNFWNNLDNSTNIKFLMDVRVSCKFYSGLIPFTFFIKDFDIFCPTCP